MVRQACLDFHLVPLKYKQNTYEQRDVVIKIENLLLEVQQFLGKQGAYDEFFRSHSGQLLYIRPLFDIVSKHNWAKFAPVEESLRETTEPDIFVPKLSMSRAAAII